MTRAPCASATARACWAWRSPLSAPGFSARNTSSGRVRRSRAPVSPASGVSAAEGPVLLGSRLQNNRVSSPRNTCRAASPPSGISLCSGARHLRAVGAAPSSARTSRSWSRRSQAQPRALRPLELREQAAGLLLAQHRAAGRRAPPRVLDPHAQQPLHDLHHQAAAVRQPGGGARCGCLRTRSDLVLVADSSHGGGGQPLSPPDPAELLSGSKSRSTSSFTCRSMALQSPFALWRWRARGGLSRAGFRPTPLSPAYFCSHLVAADFRTAAAPAPARCKTGDGIYWC